VCVRDRQQPKSPLSLEFALFAAAPCIMVAAFVLVRLEFQRGHPYPASLLVDRNKSEIGRCDVTQGAVNGVFHPHLDAHLHGGAESTIERGFQNQQIPDMHRRNKVDMVHRSGDHVRPGMAVGGHRRHQVDVMHEPAAQQVAQCVGVVGQHEFGHLGS
jgi:hypothetical protein